MDQGLSDLSKLSSLKQKPRAVIVDKIVQKGKSDPVVYPLYETPGLSKVILLEKQVGVKLLLFSLAKLEHSCCAFNFPKEKLKAFKVGLVSKDPFSSITPTDYVI